MHEEPTRPYFVPPGVTFETLPRTLQALLTDVIQPLYSETVLRAESALERQAGITLCYLAWQECLLQIEAISKAGNSSNGRASPGPLDEKKVAVYLRTAGAKQKVADFLLRYEAFRTKFQDPMWGLRDRIEEAVAAMKDTAADTVPVQPAADAEGHQFRRNAAK